MMIITITTIYTKCHVAMGWKIEKKAARTIDSAALPQVGKRKAKGRAWRRYFVTHGNFEKYIDSGEEKGLGVLPPQNVECKHCLCCLVGLHVSPGLRLGQTTLPRHVKTFRLSLSTLHFFLNGVCENHWYLQPYLFRGSWVTQL